MMQEWGKFFAFICRNIIGKGNEAIIANPK